MGRARAPPHLVNFTPTQRAFSRLYESKHTFITHSMSAVQSCEIFNLLRACRTFNFFIFAGKERLRRPPDVLSHRILLPDLRMHRQRRSIKSESSDGPPCHDLATYVFLIVRRSNCPAIRANALVPLGNQNQPRRVPVRPANDPWPPRIRPRRQRPPRLLRVVQQLGVDQRPRPVPPRRTQISRACLLTAMKSSSS